MNRLRSIGYRLTCTQVYLWIERGAVRLKIKRKSLFYVSFSIHKWTCKILDRSTTRRSTKKKTHTCCVEWPKSTFPVCGCLVSWRFHVWFPSVHGFYRASKISQPQSYVLRKKTTVMYVTMSLGQKSLFKYSNINRAVTCSTATK